ncbi:MAG TPA: tol-pal system-associated acyl-CoA thioesterase [Gammaproteobacteria bacterium]|jgi:acyl-CoA thioester hydrolase
MKEFTWPVRVYYEDTDAAGLVYHGNYLKYMERARTEWLRAIGCTQEQLKTDEGVFFVVTQASLRFLKPARFDDLLEVRAALREAGGASLSFAQSVRNAAGETLCEAEIEVACLDAATNRPRRLPDLIRKEFSDARR